MPLSAILNVVYYTRKILGTLGINFNGDIIWEFSSPPRSLVHVNSFYPMECIRQVSDSLIYNVYHIENAGEMFNAYLFFEKLSDDERYIKEGEENTDLWWIAGRTLFACKRLSYNDFSQISIGSSVAEVAAIDPMSNFYMPPQLEPYESERFDFELNEYVTYTEVPEQIMKYQAYHLLTDGILCISYSRSDPEGEFTVCAMGYNPDFEVPLELGTGTIQLKVNLIDYPA